MRAPELVTRRKKLLKEADRNRQEMKLAEVVKTTGCAVAVPEGKKRTVRKTKFTGKRHSSWNGFPLKLVLANFVAERPHVDGKQSGRLRAVATGHVKSLQDVAFLDLLHAG